MKTRGRVAGGIVVAIAAAAAMQVVAFGGVAPGVVAANIETQQDWNRWAFGSKTNPLVKGEDFCGEVVGHRYFLNASSGKDFEFECEIPAGMPIVVPIGGVTSWHPDVRESVIKDRDSLVKALSDPRGSLDGQAFTNVRHLYTATAIYRTRVHADSLIAQVSPSAPRRTRIASGAWMIEIEGLAPGEHTLKVAVDFDKPPGKLAATYDIFAATE